jgi:hypothetical protein
MTPSPRTALAYATYAAVAVFCGAEAIAMGAYPGGTWWNRATRGHAFFENYVCDLTQEVALDGSPNPGAAVGKLGMLALVVGMVPFWWSASALFVDARALSRFTRAAGLASFVGLVAVPLTPSLRFGWVHSACVLLAAGPGLLAAAMAVAGTRRAGHRGLAALGGTTLAVSAADAALYVRHVAGAGDSRLVPLLQKVALALLLAWMVAVARRVTRASATTPADRRARGRRPAPSKEGGRRPCRTSSSAAARRRAPPCTTTRSSPRRGRWE